MYNIFVLIKDYEGSNSTGLKINFTYEKKFDTLKKSHLLNNSLTYKYSEILLHLTYIFI